MPRLSAQGTWIFFTSLEQFCDPKLKMQAHGCATGSLISSEKVRLSLFIRIIRDWLWPCMNRLVVKCVAFTLIV